MNDPRLQGAGPAGQPMDSQARHAPRAGRPHAAPRGSSGSSGSSPFVPLLILLLGMVAWSGFQLHHLMLETAALVNARNNQEAPLQQAQRVRQALDTLATETRKLADAGNANAKTVLDELRKRGVTIGPPAAK